MDFTINKLTLFKCTFKLNMIIFMAKNSLAIKVVQFKISFILEILLSIQSKSLFFSMLINSFEKVVFCFFNYFSFFFTIMDISLKFNNISNVLKRSTSLFFSNSYLFLLLRNFNIFFNTFFSSLNI
jgi:hypothetical protein